MEATTQSAQSEYNEGVSHMMWWFVDTYLIVGIVLCLIMRMSWGAPINITRYLATLFLWPYIIVLGFMGKLS